MSGARKEPPVEGPASTRGVGRLAAAAALVLGAFGTVFVILWFASTAIIAIAVGILLAVVFDAAARGIGLVVGWSRRVRLAIVYGLAAVLLLAASWWAGTVLLAQAANLLAAMKALLREAIAWLQSEAVGMALPEVRLSQFLPSGTFLVGGAASVASHFTRAAGLLLAVLFLGGFLAWDPPLYKSIVLSLLPQGRRRRIDEVLDLAGGAMREWLIGQSITMCLIFLFTLCALEWVGMPDAALLAVQAGLFTFIPTLGPFLGGIAIVLAGLSVSLDMAIYGLITYVAVQFLESNLITPLVQERTIRLAPAVTLGLQVVATYLFGLLGLAFAVPLAAAGKVLVEELYVNDCLGGPWPPAAPPRHRHPWVRRLLRSPE